MPGVGRSPVSAPRTAMVIGNARYTNGLVTVDGSGSNLVVHTTSDTVSDYQSAELIVGRLGTGQLDVSNGGGVTARSLTVGQQAATVDLYGVTTYTTNGYLAPADIDAAGYGIVNINTGGTVTITRTDNTAYRGVNIGQASGTTGIVNVDGVGSTLTSQGGTGRIQVGRYGYGQLNLTNGGQVNAFFAESGRLAGSVGRITVDGDESKLTVSDEFGHWPGAGGIYLGEATVMNVGRNAGSYGYLSVTNGGTVDVINDPAYGYDNPMLRFGSRNNATGTRIW